MATTASSPRQALDSAVISGSGPYLAPIEKPKGLRLRLLYRLVARQFGKAPGWLTVFSARMPLSYTSWMGKVYSLSKKLTLPKETETLVRGLVNSLNRCTWCSDAERWYVATKMPDLLTKYDAVHEYHGSPLFNDKERAALHYVTELTETKHVRPETFARLAQHYSEREICELVWIVSSSHLFNVNNHGLNIGSDGLCELAAGRAGARRNYGPRDGVDRSGQRR